MDREDKTVTLSTMWAGVCWSGAFVLCLIGSAVALGWSDESWSRSTGLVCFAHAMLLVATGATLSVRIMLRRQTRLLLDGMLLGRTGGNGVGRLHQNR